MKTLFLFLLLLSAFADMRNRDYGAALFMGLRGHFTFLFSAQQAALYSCLSWPDGGPVHKSFC
jgi:hypothetical protein